MARRFLFTITTGRSGTCYLAELLRLNLSDAAVFHERIDYDAFGVHTPDVSHTMLFNSVGNVPKVQAFWRAKLAHDAALPVYTYVETSHMLAKAGLIENLDALGAARVDIMILRRDRRDIFLSLIERGDYRHLGGHTWLQWLDPRCANYMLSPTIFTQLHAELGSALWYVTEVFVRAEYYRLLLQGKCARTIHDVELSAIATRAGAAQLVDTLELPALAELRLPPRLNAHGLTALSRRQRQRARAFYERYAIDDAACQALARQYYESGARFGHGGLRALRAASAATL